MSRTVILAAGVLLLALCATACGGANKAALIDPNSGQIAGKIAVNGPIDPDAPLAVTLLFAGTTIVAEHVDLGKVTALATAFISGHAINYNFTQLFVGDYEVVVSSNDGAGTHTWLHSAPIHPEFNGVTRHFDSSFSFTGPGPFGSIAGTISLPGTWPTDKGVFIGVTPAGKTTPLRWPVAQADAVADTLPFSILGISVGSYTLGLYSVDAQGTVTLLGTRPAAVTLTAANLVATGADFTANFS